MSLVLDRLTPDLAGDLSDEIKELCFTRHGIIRDAFTQLKVRPRALQQHVTLRMATDAGVHVELRHVRVPSINIVKRGEDPNEEVERKSKKIAPTAESLRATFNCLVLPESHEVRAWLLCMVGKTFYFEFEDEQQQLDFGPTSDGDDDDNDDAPARAGEPGLAFEKPKRGRKAKVETDGLTNEAIAEQLAMVGVELKAKQLAAMTPAQRLDTLTWVGEYQKAREANATELPAAPSYILNPAELTEAGDVVDEPTKAAPPAKTTGTREKTTRRSSAKFRNGPRLAKGKKR